MLFPEPSTTTVAHLFANRKAGITRANAVRVCWMQLPAGYDECPAIGYWPIPSSIPGIQYSETSHVIIHNQMYWDASEFLPGQQSRSATRATAVSAPMALFQDISCLRRSVVNPSNVHCLSYIDTYGYLAADAWSLHVCLYNIIHRLQSPEIAQLTRQD